MNLTYKTVQMRMVEVEDAEFILSLRLDPKYNTYLSDVPPDIDAQKHWIERYKIDESAGSQYYLIIERLDGTRCGTVRLYDFREDSFCWGSWILNENKTRYAAIESALLVYRFGFDQLGFSKSHFEVMKGNEKVVSFHRKMGAKQVAEDEQYFYFENTKAAVTKFESEFARILK